MKESRIAIALGLIISAAGALWMAHAQEPAAAQTKEKGKKGRGGGQGRVDMNTVARPIDMHDPVWIEDMTHLELRDSLKAAKTTALIFAGGMEDNGPYITVRQHNSIVRAMCDSIARKLGNPLCAPILGMAPGDPQTSGNPGSIQLSAETYKGLISDTAASLKTEGFKNVILMVDHGADQNPTIEVSKALAEK